MYLHVAVLKETQRHDRCVALVSSVTGRLIKLGARVHI
jgi:NAD(P) transhydrogenase subunit alpha